MNQNIALEQLQRLQLRHNTILTTVARQRDQLANLIPQLEADKAEQQLLITQLQTNCQSLQTELEARVKALDEQNQRTVHIVPE